MANTNSDFIKQTATDYGLSFNKVKKFYTKYWKSGNFYDQLERQLRKNNRREQKFHRGY